MTKKFFLHTFGCQMNEYDSARIAETLERLGYEPTDEPKQADFILLNSCSIREKAEQKMLSALGRYAIYHRNRPDMKLVLAGCTAQLRGEEILQKVPELDLVMGTDLSSGLEGWLQRGGPRTKLLDRIPTQDYRFCPATPRRDHTGVSANVTIMKGCDNRCAYCVVPAARGPRIDRERGEIFTEVERMAAAGAKEVVLIGQNVNAYEKETAGFASLLREVAARPGVDRLRFTTSHPRDLDLDTVLAVAETKEVCPHFHLPVQSGSTRVLRSMGRGYTRQGYLKKVGWIRSHCPDAAISTDIIVGFPGETEDDFQETMSLLDEVGYTFIYSFCYSSRPNTRAQGMKEVLSTEEKSARLAKLQRRQEEISTHHLRSRVGSRGRVLVEGPSRHGGGQLMGRLPTFEIVNFQVGDREVLTGASVDVEITAAGHHTLEGRILEGGTYECK